MTRTAYSAAAHDRALDEHEAAYGRMRVVAALDGRSSETYRAARQAVIDAAREVRTVARRRGGPVPATRAKGDIA